MDNKQADASSFIREVGLFVSYTQSVWKVHRVLAQRHLTPRCDLCIISARHSPLEGGLCKACRDARGAPKQRPPADEAMAAELERLLDEHQGKGTGKYDALVLYSGGKDSTLLVHKLRTDFSGLRVLALSVDNTFMSPVAEANIRALVPKLGVDSMSFRPAASTMEKMYRHAFLNVGDKGCSAVVDQFDGDIIHDIGRNLASQMGIPLLVSGLSRTQCQRILHLEHFESPASLERARRTHVAGLALDAIFDRDELRLWWDGSQRPEREIPRVIFPFFVWSYDEGWIREEVERLGLLPPSAANPLLTNNRLVPLMSVHDIRRLGYSSFEPEFCEMVREGKADPHFWRPIFEMAEYSARTGRFLGASLDDVLERLRLSRAQLWGEAS